MAIYDYLYGKEIEERGSYLSVPKIFFRKEEFKDVTPEEAVLYSLFWDRALLSYKNGFLDFEGRIFIIFPLDEVMSKMRCSKMTAVKLIDELENKHRLIERKKQEIGKPTLIYIKDYIDKETLTKAYLLEKKKNKEGVLLEVDNDLPSGDEHLMRAFFRIPKVMFEDSIFDKLSLSAKILYSLFWDRLELSKKNMWCDEKGYFYIYYTHEEIMEEFNCYKEKAAKILKELDASNLIERVRQGNGAPAKIYVKKLSAFSLNVQEKTVDAEQKNIASNLTNPGVKIELLDSQSQVQKSNFWDHSPEYKNRTSEITSPSIKIELLDSQEESEYKNRTSPSTEIELLQVQKSNPNNTDSIKTYKNKTENNSDRLIDGSIIARAREADDVDNSSDGIIKVISDSKGAAKRKAWEAEDERDAVLDQIHENIMYDQCVKDFCKYAPDKELLDELVENMVEVICSKKPMTPIGREDIPTEVVREKYLSLRMKHLMMLIDRLRVPNKKAVENPQAYIRTSLYNAALTTQIESELDFRTVADDYTYRPLWKQ